jgi:hypothetical protein
MIPSAITRPGATSLSVVEVETKTGERYSFPAMDKKTLDTVLRKGSRGIPANMPVLSMLNAHYSILTIPMHDVRLVMVDGEDWWSCTG